MTLSGAIDRIQVHAAACTGVNYVPSEPPESLSSLPAVVVWPERGHYMAEASSYIREFHTIVVDFLTPRTLLKYSLTTIITFLGEFSKKIIADPTLAGAVDTVLLDSGAFPYEIVGLTWGAVELQCARMRITVKIRSTSI
jgi:hypothetical protein